MRIFLLLGLMAACSAQDIREHTYPRGFEYISKKELASSMWKLASDVHALDRLLREGSEDGRQEAAIELLGRMEVTAQGLSMGNERTNHPDLDKHLAAFIRDLEGARKAVEAEPANYFLAGAISGSCLYCHR